MTIETVTTKTERRYEAWFFALLLVWSTIFTLGSLLAISGCVGDECADPDFPEYAPCTDYLYTIRSVEDPITIPSITPAPYGVRIIVDQGFDPVMGSSVPVPGGRMAWVVWLYHWYDGDHMGALGRLAGSTECRWYGPLP